MMNFDWNWLWLTTPSAALCVWLFWSLAADLSSYTERGGKLKLRADAGLLLLVMLGLPQWYQDRGESAEERAELLKPMAAAIAKVCTGGRKAAWCVAQAWHETKLARYVLEDRCSDGPVGARCDAGRASGPWQVHSWCRDAHNKSLSMAKRFEAGARCALKGYNYGLSKCGGRVSGAFAAQHTALLGQPLEQWCTKPWAVRRVGTMQSVERRLWALGEARR